MSFVSAIKAGFKELFADAKTDVSTVTKAADAPATDARNLLTNNILTNGRTVILIALAGLFLWNAANKLLGKDDLQIIANLVWLYLLIEGAIHLVVVAGNIAIKVMELKISGKVDPTPVDGDAVNSIVISNSSPTPTKAS